jgi:hypothetical protein
VGCALSLIKFARAEDEHGFTLLPAPLVSAMMDFGMYCVKNGIRAPIVTCIARDEAKNKAVGGVPNSLHLITPEDPAGRAVDLRDSDYSDGELTRAVKWWQQRIMVSEVRWEFISGRHGTGPHFHLGVKRSST